MMPRLPPQSLPTARVRSQRQQQLNQNGTATQEFQQTAGDFPGEQAIQAAIQATIQATIQAPQSLKVPKFPFFRAACCSPKLPTATVTGTVTVVATTTAPAGRLQCLRRSWPQHGERLQCQEQIRHRQLLSLRFGSCQVLVTAGA